MQTQVAIVTVNHTESGSSDTTTACYVDGTQVMLATPEGQFNAVDIHDLAERLSAAHDSKTRYILRNMEGDWSWAQLEAAMIESGELEPTRARDTLLMKGFFRCPTCFHQWTLVNDTNDAQPCPECQGDPVEPFTSAEPRTDDEDPMVLTALADHERRYPDPEDQGTYEVYITRTATRTAVLEINDAAGPASAAMQGLWDAPNREFKSESFAHYEINGYVGRG